MENKILKFVQWLKESKYTVILTGAGMSTESGIPDFRSSDGLWKKVNPMELASIDSLIQNYDTFHKFYKMRLESLSGAKPHKGYDILAKWEADGLIDSIVTQNVDDFHLAAGNKNVYHLHGSINKYRCSKCNNPADKNDFMDKIPCRKCNGSLRPGIVLFGEELPEKELYASIDEIEKADLVIVIGTSLTVFPVSQLPDIAKGKKVYINKEIPDNSKFDLNFKETAGELLQRIENLFCMTQKDDLIRRKKTRSAGLPEKPDL
ncbi:MAG: NAD-dependent deacylase [Spirochaetia bacterium]|jgi:NAD-dependent deacetylase|nr:NAD-dependent deacylase [Spirochaetia bacterium]